jgi:hypothetical protein
MLDLNEYIFLETRHQGQTIKTLVSRMEEKRIKFFVKSLQNWFEAWGEPCIHECFVDNRMITLHKRQGQR